jgi:hypothetical protein
MLAKLVGLRSIRLIFRSEQDATSFCAAAANYTTVRKAPGK